MVDRRRADTRQPLATPTPRLGMAPPPRATPAEPDPTDPAFPVHIPLERADTAPVSTGPDPHDPGLDFEDPTKPAYHALAVRGAELRARAGRSKRPTDPLPLPHPPSNRDRQR